MSDVPLSPSQTGNASRLGAKGRLSAVLSRFSTPFTSGLFVVSAVSGIALFFHWAPGAFHEMHEWLSMVLLAPFALHLWRNWKPFVNYAKRGWLWLPLGLCLLVAVPFAVGSGTGGGGNPAFRTVALLTQTPLSQLAPVLKTTPDALVATLKGKGFSVASPDQSLNAVAATSNAAAPDLLFAVMPAGR